MKANPKSPDIVARQPRVRIVVFESEQQMAARFVDRATSTLGLRDAISIIRSDQRDGVPSVIKGAGNLRPEVWSGDAEECLREIVEGETAEYFIICDDALVVSGQWIVPLSGALEAHPGATLVGPRSTTTRGPQRVVLTSGLDLNNKSERRIFGQGWQKSHKDVTTWEHYVSSRTFATTRRLLSSHLADAQYRRGITPRQLQLGIYSALVRAHHPLIAHGSIVHFEEVIEPVEEQRVSTVFYGSSEQPLISGCLITRDEEHCLSDALTSLSPFVDELVVFDTGSTDRTIEIALSFGARVISGEWRNDFAWARNQALARCRGRWIIWIDADEMLRGSPKKVREHLAHEAHEVEALSIRIRNEMGSGLNAPSFHRAARAFKRADGMWHGAIHEMIWTRQLDRTCVSQEVDFVDIQHFGYLDSYMALKGKVARNLTLSAESNSYGLKEERDLHEARSASLAGDFRKAYDIAIRLTQEAKISSYRSLAFRVAIEAALGLGEFSKIPPLLEEFSGLNLPENFANFFKGRYYQAISDTETALGHYEVITESQVDEMGFEISPAHSALFQAECLVALHRHCEASELLLHSMESGVMDFHLGVLVETLERAGLSLGAIQERMPSDKQELVYAQTLQLHPVSSNRLLEAMYWQDPSSPKTLASASLVARHLSMDEKLKWSARLREAGLSVGCPLRHLAANDGAPAEERLRAAQLAYSHFADEDMAQLAKSLTESSVKEACHCGSWQASSTHEGDFCGKSRKPLKELQG